MKIVLSGSMLFINDMKKCAEILDKFNYEVIVPEEDIWNEISMLEISDYKRRVSMLHFSKIADVSTDSILVLNKRKEGIDNYIGANTFAEIVVAFYFHKKVYLLNDFYKPYEDELEAWGVIPLKGDLKKLVGIEKMMKD